MKNYEIVTIWTVIGKLILLPFQLAGNLIGLFFTLLGLAFNGGAVVICLIMVIGMCSFLGAIAAFLSAAM